MELEKIIENLNYLKAASLENEKFENPYSLIVLQGNDVEEFLQGLLVNNLNKLKELEGQYGAILKEEGHIFSYLFLFKKDKEYFILIEKEKEKLVLSFFNKFVLLSDVKILFFEFTSSYATLKDLANIQKDNVTLLSNNFGVKISFAKKGKFLLEMSFSLKKIIIDIKSSLIIKNALKLFGFLSLSRDFFLVELGETPLMEHFSRKSCFFGKAMNTRINSRGRVNKLIKTISLNFSNLKLNKIREINDNFPIQDYAFIPHSNNFVLFVLAIGAKKDEEFLFLNKEKIKISYLNY